MTRVRPRAAAVAAVLASAGALALVAATTATADPAAPGGSVIPVAPLRIIDTRSSSPNGLTSGHLHPSTGLPGVQIGDVAAVLMNVTVVDARAAGYIRFGDGVDTSNGNFVAKAASANLVLMPLQHSDADANYISFTASTTVSLVADVQGYVTLPAAATDSTFTPMAPKRIVDTRSSTGLTTFTPGRTQAVDVRTRAGLPSTATAVVANLTVTKPTASTYLTAWSGAGNRPVASSVNAGTGTTVANRVVLPLNAAGQVSLYNFAGRADVLVDVVGYLAPNPQGSYYVPAQVAQRLTDHSGERITLTPPLTGTSDLDTTAVWVTIASAATGPGYVVAGPTVTVPSPTSDLNQQAGRAVANAGPVMLAANNSFSVASVPSSRFVVDLDGWFVTNAG